MTTRLPFARVSPPFGSLGTRPSILPRAIVTACLAIVTSFACIDIDSVQADGGPLPRTGFFGAKIGAISSEVRDRQKLDESEGVVIEQVFPRTTAADAGFKAGDVILSISGKIADTAAFVNKVRAMRVGDVAAVEFVRDGERMSQQVTMKEPEPLRLEEVRLELAGAVRRKMADVQYLPSVSLALAKDDRMSGRKRLDI